MENLLGDALLALIGVYFPFLIMSHYGHVTLSIMDDNYLISRKAVEQSITLPNIPLYSFKPPNKVDQFRTISNQPKYISLHQRHGKGTSAQNHIYSCSSCRRQQYVIEPRRTEKGTDRLLFQIVDPEHDQSLRSQRQI